MQERKAATPAPVKAQGLAAAPAPAAGQSAITMQDRPQVPAGIPQFFAPVRKSQPPGAQVAYHPNLFAVATYQIVNNKLGMSYSQTTAHMLQIRENMTSALWDEAAAFEGRIEELSRQAPQGACFLPAPTTILQAARLEKAQKGYVDFVYRQAQVTVCKSPTYNMTSQPGESERDFRLRLQQAARERRDFEVEKLRRRYATKISGLQMRLSRAEQRIAREQEQYSQQKMQTAISVGATIFGALMGRKAISSSTLGRATTATRQASRVFREQGDVERAKEDQTVARQQLQELEGQMQQEADQLAQAFDPETEVLQTVIVRPAKADILLQAGGVLWVPFAHDPSGGVQPLW
jgi:Tfp pilus assembly protein FimT